MPETRDVTPCFKEPRPAKAPTKRWQKHAAATKAGVYAEVRMRSHDWDEQDRSLPAEAMHHRKPAGRANTVDNLLHVAHSTHRLIHANPSWSYRHGLLLRSTQDPASFPPYLGCDLSCPDDHMEMYR